MLFFGHGKLLLFRVGDDGRQAEVGRETAKLIGFILGWRIARGPRRPLSSGHSCVAVRDGDNGGCRWLSGRRDSGHALDVVEIVWATRVVDWADAAQIEGVGCAERAVGDWYDGSLHGSRLERNCNFVSCACAILNSDISGADYGCRYIGVCKFDRARKRRFLRRVEGEGGGRIRF